MNTTRLFALIFLFFITTDLFAMPADKNCNRLGQESSPYLKQHATNPVCWYPWGEEAFQAAKKSNKPIFLSIGYSTCYWCHVMEKDSFETEKVAQVLNQDFISIKVDREERPDVDDIYMDAVVAMTGRGGWPLSLALTPDLKPFWGGTFFYQDQFIDILNQLSSAFKEKPDDIKEATNQILARLQNDSKQNKSDIDSMEIFSALYKQAEGRFDSRNGGFGQAPKFPSPLVLTTLMQLTAFNPTYDSKEIVFHTLEKMAQGGLFDQIGGGFHRYSVDAQWAVPHFEKMLYDNAQLAISYLEADRLYNTPGFRQIAEETLEFISREMIGPKNNLYAALDAGEVDQEGEFYVWKYSELEELLSPDEFNTLKDHVAISEEGNFEHSTNVLAYKEDLSRRTEADFIKVKDKIYQARNKREYPHIDNKTIVSWSALAISAFVKAYQQTQKPEYLATAQKCLQYIIDHAYKNKVLYRSVVAEQAETEAVAEDYSYLIKALIDIYQADFDLKWLQHAQELQSIQDQKYWDQENGGYFSSDAKEIIIKKKDYYDHVIPSSNSISFLNLLSLNAFFVSKDYRNKLEKLRGILQAEANSFAYGHPVGIQGLLKDSHDFYEVVVVKPKDTNLGSPIFEKLQEIPQANYVLTIVNEGAEYPDLAKKRKTIDGSETYYICQNQHCKLPTNELNNALKLLNQ